MRRFWLLFAQTVTVGLALWFIVLSLQPDWVRGLFKHSNLVNYDAKTQLMEAKLGPTAAHSSYRDAANKALPAVVNISTSKDAIGSNPTNTHPFLKQAPEESQTSSEENKPERPLSSGSGVILSTQGHIITNQHVIADADEIKVTLSDGRSAKAVVIGTDPDTDLAVLKINMDKLPIVTLAHSESAQVGDVVLAIGNPFRVGQTVTMGIVSALGRDDVGINFYEDFIQTDAAVNPGNSGGALIDSNGNLLGVNTLIYSRTGGSLGIGFAIPSATIKNVFENILKHGQVIRGWIGIEPQEITEDMAKGFGLKQKTGVIISGVVRDAPAFQAGIRPGDIVLEIEGKKILHRAQLLRIIAQLQPNTKAKFKLLRKSETLTILVGLIQRPASK
jgi:serine protease DegQ